MQRFSELPGAGRVATLLSCLGKSGVSARVKAVETMARNAPFQHARNEHTMSARRVPHAVHGRSEGRHVSVFDAKELQVRMHS